MFGDQLAHTQLGCTSVGSRSTGVVWLAWEAHGVSEYARRHAKSSRLCKHQKISAVLSVLEIPFVK